ncbi:hypothetical protein IFM89_007306 [Coptis chinensis]|uniref:S-locus receptor kinase C-terminal domain-containing protein n=1 Tax=Coptis chinensis TaxID=261450 RepID=A0A835GV01_9MAGN|nr:hypothetical protein IFM89_007306 [Coptis chinensis]
MMDCCRHGDSGRKGRRTLDLVEPTLRECYSRNEVMRCIQTGLLCVQDEVARRPTMASVVSMLNSYSVTLPLPTAPAFFGQERLGEIVTRVKITVSSNHYGESEDIDESRMLRSA